MRTRPHPRSLSRRERGGILILLACAALSGCAGATESETDVAVSETVLPAEPTWETQLAAVRDGSATRIAISQQLVTPDQWRQLADGCEAIERLEVDAGEMTAADLELLAALPNLTLLKLGAEVDDDGMAHIATVESLEVLNLPEGRFHDQSLTLLADLPRLKQLRFHSPHVTDDGMRIIATLPSLRYLHIISCPITADGLKHMYGMTELQSFYLDGSDIEDEAVYELLESLPSLHFHRDQLHLPDDPHGHEHAHA